MNRILTILLLSTISLSASDKIVGTWDYKKSSTEYREIWHFTERGNILREYYILVDSINETYEWMSVSGRWKKKEENKRVSYVFTWFNDFKSSGEFSKSSEKECLEIWHGDIGFDLLRKQTEIK